MYVGCVKVEVKQWCFLLPTSHMKTADSAAIDPLSAVHDVFTARQLSDSIVVCTPEFSLYSSGRMHTDTIADIPVKRVEHAIASKEYLYAESLYCIDYLGRKINLSGISSAKCSQPRPNSVHVDRSRGDNVQGILGVIGPFWPKWELGCVPRSQSFFCLVNHATFRQLRNG